MDDDGLRPDDPDEAWKAHKVLVWIGVGIPTLIGAVTAALLGLPIWIVAVCVALVAITVLANN